MNVKGELAYGGAKTICGDRWAPKLVCIVAQCNQAEWWSDSRLAALHNYQPRTKEIKEMERLKCPLL